MKRNQTRFPFRFILRFLLLLLAVLLLREPPAIHTMDRTTPPSTRSADPLVAEARGLHR
jgi:hypothetical protein